MVPGPGPVTPLPVARRLPSYENEAKAMAEKYREESEIVAKTKTEFNEVNVLRDRLMRGMREQKFSGQGSML